MLTACSPPEEARTHQFFVFGTMLDITTWGVSEEVMFEVNPRLQELFNHLHRDWHAWESGELMRVNEAFSQGQAIETSTQILNLVNRSRLYEQQSDGRFNPAIGELINLWGFHTSVYPIQGPPPDRQAIEKLLATRPTMADIRSDGLLLESGNRAVRLDFGGIAKGYAIDLALELLREHGIDNAIVNAGGDLSARGSKGNRAWRVAVRRPGGGLVGGLEVNDEAVFTSGVYERFREDEHSRYPHIIDPRTGWPVTQLSSVTVITDDGMKADAAATALTVAGHPGWKDVALKMGLDQVMVISEDGIIHVTPAMHARMSYEDGIEARVTDPARKD